ncbi:MULTISPECIES: amino acid-binding protein [unclassified Adlercreutzia]|uniref:amino acid-binding protein n=1 Tax=unclassified Adlercreutzia TaxID=2636013 RepID=UPI0013EA0B00|nr:MULTISPECIES: amino acid-binding protein [unclassified Adlercreutzia]
MIQQITVFLENKEGRLSAMCRVLSEAGIDMKALTIAETAEYGLVRLIADDPEAALAALHAADYRAISTNVVAIALENRPGSLSELLEKLDDMGVNIEYGYCFAFKGEQAVDVFKVADAEQAAVKLAAAGFKVVKAADLA